MKKKMKSRRRLISAVLTCALTVSSFPAAAQEALTEEALTEEAAAGTAWEGQLTRNDLSVLNGGAEKVYSHNDRVTLVDGTCSGDPVTDMEEAAVVVDSMKSLIGAAAETEFIPWREVTDPMGNIYYIFQQIYEGTTVCGGAVKVITDAGGNMIALSSSVESKMPEVTEGEALTAAEAEELVRNREYRSSGRTLDVMSQFTDRVILPTVLRFDIENEDMSSRFAWVVYTNNPSSSIANSSDLPYLAHYVSMSGEYLYNMPAITPDDEAGRAGYASSYVFEFMEPAEYTGYVDLSDGTEKEISVTVMRDKRTGMYYLGNIERRIIVAECYDFLYNDGQIVLEASPDNLEWDQVGLLSLYNYCRAWDYYNEIGWASGDGEGTPILILNNFCDDHYNAVNNACYIGEIYGMQCFAASNINDLSQCMDVIAHEFTHAVTGSLMTYNSYMNDYGAINEAMSDIQGKNCAMMLGDVDLTDWVMGSTGSRPIRSMSDPHAFHQPEFAWDLYYIPNVLNPGDPNDHGGVHFNSSLLNVIGFDLISEGGMTLDEARTFWFMTACAMVPQTDYTQMSELLPWVLQAAGMERYADTLSSAIERTRLGEHAMPETISDDRAVLTLSLPDTEAFDSSNWMLLLTSVKVGEIVSGVMSAVTQLASGDLSFLPESLRALIEDTKAAREEMHAAEKETENSDAGPVEVFFTTLLESLASMEEAETEEALTAQEELPDEVRNDLMNWLQDAVDQVLFQSYGFAGQDGSTLTMIVRPGRTIPILQHATVKEGTDQLDQVVVALYLGGRWYGASMEAMMAVKEGKADMQTILSDETKDRIVQDLFGENFEKLRNIRSLEDVLDMLTVEIKGGEVIELSADGLDELVIPEPTPPEEKPYGTLEPGKKSRPKTEEATEEVTEAATETGGQ